MLNLVSSARLRDRRRNSVERLDRIEVAPALGARGLREFLALPERLYAADPHWVPPLRSEERRFFSHRNPYFENNGVQLFVARERGVTVGRIAATVCTAHNIYHAERTGFFGFFECDGRPATARALLDAAAGFLRERGLDTMRGPYNLTTNHTCGLLIDGFDGPPLIDMPYNPPGYAALLEDAGLEKAKDLVAHWLDLDRQAPARAALAELARQAPGDCIVREMHRSGRGLAADMDAFYDLYHHAWRANWGFVPFDRDEYAFLVKRLRPVLRPGLSYVASVGGEPAGMFIGVPDFNRVLAALGGRLTPLGLLRAVAAGRRIDAARFLLTGIYDRFRGTPVAALLLHHCLEGAARKGYRGVEVSWVLEDNAPANRFFAKHGFAAYRRYRVYEKSLP